MFNFTVKNLVGLFFLSKNIEEYNIMIRKLQFFYNIAIKHFNITIFQIILNQLTIILNIKNIIIMELIDFFKTIQITHFFFQQIKKQEIPQNLHSYQHKNTKKNTSKFIPQNNVLSKFQGGRLFNNIKIIQNSLILINIQIANLNFIKCRNIHQRIFFIKYLLNFNKKTRLYQINVSPVSGQLYFTIKIYAGNLQNFCYSQIIQDLIQYIYDLNQQIITQFSKILYLKDQQINFKSKSQIEQKRKIFVRQLKIYMVSSPNYAWRLLEGKTKSKKNNSQYEETKKKFRTNIKISKQNEKIKVMNTLINSCKYSQMPIFPLKIDQDEDLKNKYLKNVNLLKKDNKIQNLITVDGISKQKMKQKRAIKFLTQQFGKIKVNAQYSSEIKGISYEKQLLKQLPEYQMIGLPRYYYLKNLPTQNINYVFTNLHETIIYQNYLKNNFNTISIQTKIYLLIQISQTLNYLKSNSIIYHNLTPTTVKIKKGLIAKLSNFSHSYSQNLRPNQQFTPYQNIFPYVSNVFYGKFKTIDNQKSDSYSFANLIYESIYNKKIYDIKQSQLYNDQTQIFKKLCEIRRNSTQDMSKINNKQGRLFGKLLLDSACHEMGCNRNKYKSDKQEDGDWIKSRGFLDWFEIILKHIYEFNLNLVCFE